MTFHRRHLPHLYEIGHPVFLTWRLHGSLPTHRAFPESSLTTGQAFALMDRLLEEARSGPFFLKQPPIAEMICEALEYNAKTLGHFELHAFVLMPNHVHLLLTPRIELPELTRSLKGITAKRANLMLNLTGSSFWQQESYDHLVRDDREFERIRSYIEQNPVRAGLAKTACDYRWSSAAVTK